MVCDTMIRVAHNVIRHNLLETEEKYCLEYNTKLSNSATINFCDPLSLYGNGSAVGKKRSITVRGHLSSSVPDTAGADICGHVRSTHDVPEIKRKWEPHIP
jgi:hypothetical protein